MNPHNPHDLPRWATSVVLPMLNLLSALLVAALVSICWAKTRSNR